MALSIPLASKMHQSISETPKKAGIFISHSVVIPAWLASESLLPSSASTGALPVWTHMESSSEVSVKWERYWRAESVSFAFQSWDSTDT